MVADVDRSDTPVNVPPPSDADVERDRMRRLKDAELERIRAAAEAAREKARRHTAEEVARRRAAAATRAAMARQAAADAQGAVLRPTGAARRALIGAVVLFLLAQAAAIATMILVREPMVRLLAGVAAAVAGAVSWYLWWVGLVAFLSDKIGDAVAKRIVPELRAGGDDGPLQRP